MGVKGAAMNTTFSAYPEHARRSHDLDKALGSTISVLRVASMIEANPNFNEPGAGLVMGTAARAGIYHSNQIQQQKHVGLCGEAMRTGEYIRSGKDSGTVFKLGSYSLDQIDRPMQWSGD